MQNFYAPPERFSGDTIILDGDEYRHAARVCRVRTGELIGVTNGRGRRVEARVGTIGRDTIEAVVERDVSGSGEPAADITLALALIKPSRFEEAVEYCTELGVRRIVPVHADRCERESFRLRDDRLSRIALEAAKQSARSWVPEMADTATVDEVCAQPGLVIAAIPGSRASVREAVSPVGGMHDVTIIIGPEGDFSPEETALMTGTGVIPVSLGGLILRAETAAAVAVALVCDALR